MAKARFRLGIAIKSLFRRKSRYSWDHVGFSWFVYLGRHRIRKLREFLGCYRSLCGIFGTEFRKNETGFWRSKDRKFTCRRKERASRSNRTDFKRFLFE